MTTTALAVDAPWLVDGAEVVSRLGADRVSGITSTEAAARLARFGPNRLESAREAPAWRQFVAEFAHPLVYLLLAAVVASVVAWALEGGDGAPLEAAVIAAIVLINGVLGFVQERKAEEAVAALQRMVAPAALVVRDGKERRVPVEAIVPGDLLVLREGDVIAADGRVLEATTLTVAEASLTGESVPVLKDSATLSGNVPLGDRHNMVFSGTTVTRGTGRAVVTATGRDTEMGRVASLLGRVREDPTPLQREIAVVGRTLGFAAVAIALIVVTIILPTSGVDGVADVVDVLALGVSLAVAAVPEGLPTILTVVLALGVRRMARQRAIVKELSSVETLGSTSVICSDKTGTLTKNEMTIQRVLIRSGEVEVTGVGYRPEGEVRVKGKALGEGPLLEEVRAVLCGGALANDAALVHEDGGWTIRGDPTDAAFLVAARKLGSARDCLAHFRRVAAIPFSSERKLMTVVLTDAVRDGRLTVVTKGAPDVLLARCTHEQVGTALEELTDARRAEIQAAVDRLAEAALRAIAVGFRQLETTEAPRTDESVEQDLVLAGVVGMIDPPRPEVHGAIAHARRAGLRVIMITGDHPRTAARIAADLGILMPNAPPSSVLNGVELETLGDDVLAKKVREASVYARVAPEHKLRIVEGLRADGHVVAMTGDGVNDAPALRAADIGVAMGSGTDVAKQAARMVLADDNFATIVSAVREGRAIFANIRKVLLYLLSSNAAEVLTVFFGVVGASVIGLDVAEGSPTPLLASQILWINLLTDSGPAVALGVEPPPEDVMDGPPRKPADGVIDRNMVVHVLLAGVIMAATTLLAIDLWLPGGLVEGSADLAEARTAGFTVLVLAQLFNCLNSRSERNTAFRGVMSAPFLLVAIATSVILQIVVTGVPAFNQAFGTSPLSGAEWALCTAMASSVLWIIELKKLILRRSASSRRSVGRAPLA